MSPVNFEDADVEFYRAAYHHEGPAGRMVHLRFSVAFGRLKRSVGLQILALNVQKP